MKPNKIYILGTVGSGKSTLAKKLSKLLSTPHYDLDDVFWSRKFNIKRKPKDRDSKLSKLCNKRKWIIEGVYARVWVKPAIKKSDLVVFLDIPLHTLIYRITKRTIMREKSKRRGRKRYNENFRNYVNLIKAVIKYKRKKGYRGYVKHRSMVANKMHVVYVRNNRQISKFLDDTRNGRL